MINKYEFSKGTLAIVPNDEHSSLVLEDKDRYIVQNKPFQIMEDSCSYFGSSFEGRKEGTKKLLGITHKSPIIIEETRKIIFFPTTSPQADDCVWVSLQRVKKIQKTDFNNTRIIFDNDKEITVNCSYRTIENQLSRASRLDIILRNHKNS